MVGDIRIGKVSRIDYENGMIAVTYEDLNGDVSGMIPMLANGEYRMPEIGQSVLTISLSSGNARNICLGTIWNKGNKPSGGAQGVYRKDMGVGCGISAAGGSLSLSDGSGTVSVAQIIAALAEK